MPNDYRANRAVAARHVLTVQNDQSAFVRGDDGVVRRDAPGSFVTALIEAMLRADSVNLGLLAIGFPAYAWAVTGLRTTGGVVRLREVAGWPLDDSHLIERRTE